MALRFSRDAKHWTPAGPICFRSYRGIELMPELFLPLKCWASTWVSSGGVIWWDGALERGGVLIWCNMPIVKNRLIKIFKRCHV